MTREARPHTGAGAATGRVNANDTANSDSRQPRRPLHMTITCGSRADAWQLGFDAGRASGQREGYADALRAVWRQFPELRPRLEKLAHDHAVGVIA